MDPELSICFTEMCPPLRETFSGRPRPCPPSRGDCPHLPLCEEEQHRRQHTAGQQNPLSEVFAFSYQGPVHITLAEPSGSFVIRSEHHFHGREMFRMALRRHLYEVVAAPAPAVPRTAILDPCVCPSLDNGVRLGQYIGFIDLRRHYEAAPLALGLLSAPSQLRVDPDAHLVLGNYGPLFGGAAFPCSVYSQQDRTAGAACAQACIIMVLGMLSDRHARLEGSYTLTQSGNAEEPSIPPLSPGRSSYPPGLAELSEQASVTRVFPVAEGLRPSQIVSVLNRQGTYAARTRLRLGPTQPPDDDDPAEEADLFVPDREVQERLAQRIIECHIQARCPVILGVEAYAFHHGRPRDGKRPVGHALTVVGMRKGSSQRRHPCLILHDPASRPYLERPLRDVLDACNSYSGPDKAPRVVMILATEQSVRCSLAECLAWIQSQKSFSCFDAYFGSQALAGGPCDYQFSLLHPKDINAFLWPVPLDRDQRADVAQQLALRGGRYWGMASYTDSRLRAAWLFRADQPVSDAELTLYAIEPDRQFHILRNLQDPVGPLRLPPEVTDACF